MSVDRKDRQMVHEEILEAIGLDKEHMRTMEGWSRDRFNRGESIQYKGDLKLPRSLRHFTRGQIHEAVSVALEGHPGFSYVRVSGPMTSSYFKMPGIFPGWIAVTFNARL